MRRILCAVFLFCFAMTSFAEEEAPQAFKWDNMLTLETITNFNGLNESGSRYLANLDVTLTVDTGQAGWWQNGTFYIYGLGDWGQRPSELTGEYQTLSNIEAPNAAKLLEFWYQHSFFHDDVKLLFGLHDYNSTFYTLDAAGLFSDDSFGTGPEVSQVSPSVFPTTAVGTVLSFDHDVFYGRVGVYDGVPGDPNNPRGTHVMHKPDEGLFKAAEFGIESENDYKIGLGTWQLSAKVPSPVDGNNINSNSGFYTLGQKNLSEDLAIFFRYGRANPKKNQLSEYRAMGFTESNLFMKSDRFGLGYSQVLNGPDFLKNNPDLLKSETVLEATYLWPLSESINAQASLYNIDHPSMSKDEKNTLALGLRLYIAF